MSEVRSGHIREINGPILRVHMPSGRNGEQIRIGSLDIVGEIIALDGDEAIVQAYESTEGLRPGETVQGLGHPLTVELGPGLLQGIFDGVQRPLNEIARLSGDNIPRGLRIDSLDREREWPFEPNIELEIGVAVDERRGHEALGAVAHPLLPDPEMLQIDPAFRQSEIGRVGAFALARKPVLIGRFVLIGDAVLIQPIRDLELFEAGNLLALERSQVEFFDLGIPVVLRLEIPFLPRIIEEMREPADDHLRDLGR